MRHLLVISTVFSFLFFKTAYAQSDYVLPYPSFMPGSRFYKIHLLREEVMKYWYFGDFSQFKYNLEESDKYLVQAKTLFEYKQYFLAYASLKKSDRNFRNIKPHLKKAKAEGKNITQKENILKNAALKHIEVLNFIKTITPESFMWTPEKTTSTNLNLKEAIEESIKIRNVNNRTIDSVSIGIEQFNN